MPLFVIILAALVWNLCNCDLEVEPHQPHTEQHYLECGSTMLKYNAFKEATYRNVLACFKILKLLIT